MGKRGGSADASPGDRERGGEWASVAPPDPTRALGGTTSKLLDLELIVLIIVSTERKLVVTAVPMCELKPMAERSVDYHGCVQQWLISAGGE